MAGNHGQNSETLAACRRRRRRILDYITGHEFVGQRCATRTELKRSWLHGQSVELDC
jgi:hypothetical protein